VSFGADLLCRGLSTRNSGCASAPGIRPLLETAQHLGPRAGSSSAVWLRFFSSFREAGQVQSTRQTRAGGGALGRVQRLGRLARIRALAPDGKPVGKLRAAISADLRARVGATAPVGATLCGPGRARRASPRNNSATCPRPPKTPTFKPFFVYCRRGSMALTCG